MLKREPLLRIANLQEMLGTSCEHFKLLNENEKKIVKSRKKRRRIGWKKEKPIAENKTDIFKEENKLAPEIFRLFTFTQENQTFINANVFKCARAKSRHVEFIFFLRKRKKKKKSQVHKTNKTIYFIQYTTLLPLLQEARISRLVNKLNTLVFLYTFLLLFENQVIQVIQSSGCTVSSVKLWGFFYLYFCQIFTLYMNI